MSQRILGSRSVNIDMLSVAGAASRDHAPGAPRYRILGTLAVDGCDVTASRDRVVLAMLLLHPERVVGLGDRAAVATVANYLAASHGRTGDFDRAMELLRMSIRLRGELGLRSAQATSMGNLASFYEGIGRFRECVETAYAARRLAAEAGDAVRGRVQLHYLGVGHMRLGEWTLALSDIQQIKRRLGTMTIGTAHRYVAAALGLMRRHGFRFGEADTRNALACLLRDEGRFAEALDEHRAALAAVQQGHDRREEAVFLGEFAATRLAAGDEPGANELYERMLRIAKRLRLPHLVAGAEAGIAACRARREPDGAGDRLRTPAAGGTMVG